MACERSVHFEVSASLQRRVLRVRLSGSLSAEHLQALAASLSQAAAQFQGKRYMVVADTRGLKPLHPHLAKILCELIGRGRKSGCALCVHLSDLTVARLSAQRLARENSAEDDITVDVSSDAEAERVVDEARCRLDDGRYGASVRDSIAA
ncbi:MAG TPA: hypothetical protein VLV17_05145 [Anaeromyxobacteraceae bacterium]|nr:hypothetical protein [Anaeromyxobacteraceae bacterium]